MTESLEPVGLVPRLAPLLPVSLVQDSDDLARLTAAVNNSKEPVAIDAERASGFRYGQRAYLIQIAVQDSCIFLLDPTIEYEAKALADFRSALNEATWIIHAASQDLPCLAEFGLKPKALLDTELAGRLLGLAKVSLGSLTELYLNQSLAKEHSAVDWSTRPLPTPWITYAALDVDVLFELWDAISKDLLLNNKMQIALEEFQKQKNFEIKSKSPERWRSTNGIHELKEAKDLTILKFLWQARENLAQEKDIAPGRLVPDASLIAVIKAAPKSRSELASLRNFAGRASRTYIDLWWKAYESGMHSLELVEIRAKTSGIPNHRNWPTKFPDAHRRLLWSKKLLQELATQVKIPLENLLAPETLKAICFEPPELTKEKIRNSLRLKGARNWQIDLVDEIILKAFQKDELPEKEPITQTDSD